LSISSFAAACFTLISSNLVPSQSIMGKTAASSRQPLLLCRWSLGLVFCTGASLLGGPVASAGQLTQRSVVPEEVPEEVLQIQVGVEANSGLTGQVQAVDVYAQEQQLLQIKGEAVPPRLAPSIYRTMELLRLRKILKGLLPFF
jgi:hypothetical protein